MGKSLHWVDGRFRNPQPVWHNHAGALAHILRHNFHKTFKKSIPVQSPTREQLETEPSSGLRATWMGHSTVLLTIDGVRVLTDPVWGMRVSPVGWAGPSRLYAPPLPLHELPVPHAIVISHDHYDHLDRSTIRRMKDWDTRFIVPLGVGARLVHWGIPYSRITELDWWESAIVNSLEIVCTPARHASGRGLFDKDRTLWAGFAFLGKQHRVYFSGDTGFFPGLADIGQRLGPFDLTLIESGAYGQAWPDWHLGPEQAVKAHILLRGRILLPIHWSLFKLGAHGWTEPVERVLAAAESAGVPVVVPRPGESVEPGVDTCLSRWWPSLPWKTAVEMPIQATADGKKPISGKRRSIKWIFKHSRFRTTKRHNIQ